MRRRHLAAMLCAAALGAADARAEAPAGDPPASSTLPAHPAAQLDPSPFSHAARLVARPSAEGVAVLQLSPEVLAVARPDLADVRVVDAAFRQWPYLVADETGHEARDLHVGSPRQEQGRSRYELGLPVGRAALGDLELRVDRAFFDRSFRLMGEIPGGRRELLVSGRLTRAAGGPPTAPAEEAIAVRTITFPRARVTALSLFIDDGDEAPLAVVAARASFPVVDLRLVAPAGEYSLIVGDAEAHPPRYEIAHARAAVLAARAGVVEAGPLERSRQYKAREGKGIDREQMALWGVMIFAIAALGALTLRLARREEAAEPPGEGEGEGKAREPPPPGAH
jgi:hypothetical protein